MSKIKREIVDELHKNVRLNFRRRKYKQVGIGNTLQADLVDLSEFSKDNRGYKYLLTVIDIFSKYAFAKPLKTKTTTEVTKAFNEVLEKYKKNIRFCHTDAGGEFTSKEFQKLMKDKKIHHYTVTTSRIKSGIVERFNRTLKKLMFKNFNYIGEWNWIDHIDDLVKKYNNTVHSTIKMAPSKVKKKHERYILRTAYNDNIKLKSTSDLNVGDYVRINDVSGTFRRGFKPNWSAGIFQIREKLKTDPITFKLLDYNNKPLNKTFYRQELARAKYPNVYLVEKIIRKKGNKVLVKWLGFDESYNSWEDQDKIV